MESRLGKHTPNPVTRTLNSSPISGNLWPPPIFLSKLTDVIDYEDLKFESDVFRETYSTLGVIVLFLLIFSSMMSSACSVPPCCTMTVFELDD